MATVYTTLSISQATATVVRGVAAERMTTKQRAAEVVATGWELLTERQREEAWNRVRARYAPSDGSEKESDSELHGKQAIARGKARTRRNAA